MSDVSLPTPMQVSLTAACMLLLACGGNEEGGANASSAVATQQVGPVMPSMPPAYAEAMLSGARAMIAAMSGQPPAEWTGVAYHTGESLDNVRADYLDEWRTFAAAGTPTVIMAGMRLGFSDTANEAVAHLWALPDGKVRFSEAESAIRSGLTETQNPPELAAAVTFFNLAVEHPDCPFPVLATTDLPTDALAALGPESEFASEAGYRAETVSTALGSMCTRSQQSVGPSNFGLISVYATQRGQDIVAYVRAGNAYGLLQGIVEVTPARLKFQRVTFTWLLRPT